MSSFQMYDASGRRFLKILIKCRFKKRIVGIHAYFTSSYTNSANYSFFAMNFPVKMAPDKNWMNYRGPASLAAVRFGSSPPPTPSTVTELDRRHTGGGGWVGEEPNHTTEWTILSAQGPWPGYVDVVIKSLTWQTAVKRDMGGKVTPPLNYCPISQKIYVIIFHDDVDAHLLLFYFLRRLALRCRWYW